MIEFLERIKEVITDSVGDDLIFPIANIDENESLKEYGLDSLSTIQLLIALEHNFGVEFSSSEILYDMKFSINEIGKLVYNKTISMKGDELF